MTQTQQTFGTLGWACLLAVTPLATGVAIFLLWCATEWEFLQGLGMLNIMFGLLAVVIGAVFLVAHFARATVTSPIQWGEVAKVGAVAGVMALNFPVCMTIVDAFFRLESVNRMRDSLEQSSVRVINLVDEPIAAAVVTGMRSGVVRSIAKGEGASLFFESTDNPKLTIRWDDSGDRDATVALPAEQRGTMDFVALVRSAGDDGVDLVSVVPRQADVID